MPPKCETLGPPPSGNQGVERHGVETLSSDGGVVGVVRNGLFCVVCEEVHICVQASRGGKIEDLAAR